MDLNMVLALVGIVLSAFVGYFFGVAKSFREQKQKAYAEILSPIVKMVFDTQSSNETEFSQALTKLWLYASKEVALKVDKVVYILHHPNEGNVQSALREAIVAMRTDIQLFPWQKLRPDDVEHLYSKIVRK